MAASTRSGVSLASVLWNTHRSQAMMALYHPFVVSLAAGVLDIRSFRNYIAQDAFFLQAYSTAYHILRDNVDDGSSKLTVNHLLQSVMDELQMHSYLQAWGVDSSIASHPNNATVKYTNFLLATARGEESKTGETALLDRQRLAAFTVGAMAPCMRLYAFLGQEIQSYLGGDCPDTPYHEWINKYSSNAFQSSTSQMEGLLDTLSACLSEDDVSKLENLYSQAFTLELEFFSAQPNCQCTLLPFIRRQIDGSDASYLLMTDFDLTCSVTDSCSALANVSVQAASKKGQDVSLPQQKSAAEIRSCWDILEKTYSDHYSRISIPPDVKENCDRPFDVDGLRSFLKHLSDFEIESNIEVIRRGVFQGLNLDDVWNAGHVMLLQEGCSDCLRQLSFNSNVNVHIISVCWSKSFVKGALSKEGLEHVEVHSNELVTSGSYTSGDIKRMVETPFDKERVFKELMHSAESLSKSVRSIYIGDSVTDILCLLKADLGIVIGSNLTLQKVAKAFGVLMMPLYKGVLEMVKLGSPQVGKNNRVIYTVTDWHEIRAFLIGNSEG